MKGTQGTAGHSSPFSAPSAASSSVGLWPRGGAVPYTPSPAVTTARDDTCKVLQATYCLSGWRQSHFPNENTEVKSDCPTVTYVEKELGFESHFFHFKKRILIK